MKTGLFVCWWLVNLVSVGHTQQPPRSESVKIILYRQKEFGGKGYGIYINDRKIGTLPPNHYLEVDLSPGRTKIESGKDYFTDTQTIWLELRSGQTYYLKAVEEMDFLRQALLLAPVRAEQGKLETQRIKRSALVSLLPN